MHLFVGLAAHHPSPKALGVFFRHDRRLFAEISKMIFSMISDFYRNMHSCKHSGFSIDNSVRILDEKSGENLAQYIARPPVSLKKIHYEGFKGRVLFHTHYNEYFKENVHMLRCLRLPGRAYRKAWARLLSKVYEIDPMVCHGCMGEQRT